MTPQLKKYLPLVIAGVIVAVTLLYLFVFRARFPSREVSETRVRDVLAQIDTGDEIALEKIEDYCGSVPGLFSGRPPTACSTKGTKYWVTKSPDGSFANKVTEDLIGQGFLARQCLLGKNKSSECTAESLKVGSGPSFTDYNRSTAEGALARLWVIPSGGRQEQDPFANRSTYTGNGALDKVYVQHNLPEKKGYFLYALEYYETYSVK